MSEKLKELPEDLKHYVKVSEMAKELGCDIRHIYYAIRQNYVASVDLQDSKYVNPEDTRRWYNNRTGKRGRKPTRDAASLEQQHGVQSGTILHTVVEVQRRVQVVEEVKETDAGTVVALSGAKRRYDKFKDVTFVMSQKLHESLANGDVTLENDRMQVLEALARSFELAGQPAVAKQLYEIKDQLTTEGAAA